MLKLSCCAVLVSVALAATPALALSDSQRNYLTHQAECFGALLANRGSRAANCGSAQPSVPVFEPSLPDTVVDDPGDWGCVGALPRAIGEMVLIAAEGPGDCNAV